MSSQAEGFKSFGFLARLFGHGRSPALTHVPIDSASAIEVARLHHQGGFARGWSATECEALLADRAVCADGARRRDGRLAAAVLSRMAADEAEILVVLVDRGLRGRGVGRGLMAHHLAGLARLGVTRIFLEVDEANAPARALYARLGFETAGERPGYYAMPDGQRATALILRHDLAP